MELKRKYREVKSKSSPSGYEIKKNNWFRRNLFSLTGVYYHLSRYGEDLFRPTLVGALIVFMSTFFFACQKDPNLIPAIPINFLTHNDNFSDTKYTIYIGNITSSPINPISINSTSTTPYSEFVGIDKMIDPDQWEKSFVRAMGDFIPLVSMPSDIKISLVDYIIKIVGGAVTFGLIAIALRRRFERKYTH